MDTDVGIKGDVCVTGASGFIASWLIKRLLDSGYRVKGTVRDPGDHKKVAHLWELEGAEERLRLVKADLMGAGSFDDAIMGCEGVFHTASPVVVAESDPKAEILEPAVAGTLNVLQSCKRNPALKRVVLTSSSSVLRVREDIDPAIPLDESSWGSVELCKRLQLWYALAKIMAEKAAWEFAEANGISLVTVLPSFVVGPCLPRDLSLTVSDVLGLLRDNVDDLPCNDIINLNRPPRMRGSAHSADDEGRLAGNPDKFSRHGRMGYVHVDDVARCHILVYEDGTARGRYLCSSTVLENHQLAALLSNRYPSLPIPTRFRDHYKEVPYVFDTSKLCKMGFRFKGVEEMFDDCIQHLKQRGYLTFHGHDG